MLIKDVAQIQYRRLTELRSRYFRQEESEAHFVWDFYENLDQLNVLASHLGMKYVYEREIKPTTLQINEKSKNKLLKNTSIAMMEC